MVWTMSPCLYGSYHSGAIVFILAIGHYCNLIINIDSFLHDAPDAYPKSEIIYTWKKGPLYSVEVPQESSSLLQYDLIGQTVSSETIKSNTGKT